MKSVNTIGKKKITRKAMSSKYLVLRDIVLEHLNLDLLLLGQRSIHWSTSTMSFVTNYMYSFPVCSFLDSRSCSSVDKRIRSSPMSSKILIR
jgi:hypothetical protein